jgi:hypothetical protein
MKMYMKQQVRFSYPEALMTPEFAYRWFGFRNGVHYEGG